jgi:hypothetical protein
MKIVSGAQTGVDRAALDVALQLGIDCGGWCPLGRTAEDGLIPMRYPVREVYGDTNRDRTRQNVIDSDGTMILFESEPRGGTAETIAFCRDLGKPHLLIDAKKTRHEDAASDLSRFVFSYSIATLNVAGPRASEWLDGASYTNQVLRLYFAGIR